MYLLLMLRKLLIACILLGCLVLSVAAQGVSDTDWTQASPAQIHQQMWETKSRALMAQKYGEQHIAQAATPTTQANYDVLHYNVFIRVNDTTQVLYGRVKFIAKATEAGVSQVQVDLYDNMTLDSIMSPGGNLTYTRSTNVVTVNLGQTYNTGDQFSFTFVYHGHPIEGGFQAFSFSTRTSGKVMTSLSEPYFARTWWPCKDRPDDKADSFKIAIEVDTTFYVGSNGSLDSVKTSSPNTKTYFYTEHYPMTTYLFSVSISRYTVWHDHYVYNGGLDTMLITHAVYPDWYTYSLPRWGITPQALALLSQSFGPYPFLTEKYGHSNFQWGGGMEHQTMTSMVGSSFGFAEPTVVHEMTHQWFGDMITCNSWGHIWLNEGFASYGEAVYYLNRDGWQSYHNYMTTMDFTRGGTIYIYDTTSVGNIFGSIVYDKGAWVLHMLRRVLGETKFQLAMMTYVNSIYKHKSATTEQFRDVVEAATGVELDWFFQEWIYGTYRPNYQYSSYTEPSHSGGYDTYVVVKQTQTTSPQVFVMPIDFVLEYPSGTHDTLPLMVDTQKKLLKIHTADSVKTVQLDPDNWVLKYNMELPWPLYIITTSSDLSAGVKLSPYRDTIEQRGAIGKLVTTILSGSLPPGLVVDSSGVIHGVPSDTGTYTFTVKIRDVFTGYSDQTTLTMHIGPAVPGPGDVNFSGGPVDISDLSLLVAYLVNPGITLPSPALADVNNDCIIDVSDLSIIVSYLTGRGGTMQLGCAP